jgi:hypothetical protein
MRVELVSLRNGITKKKRLNVVSDAINKSKSDLVLFCGHSVFDWNDCVELSEKLVNKDSIVLFEAKKVDESTFLMRKNCLFRIEQGRLVNMFTNQFFASSKEIEGNELLCEHFIDELENKRCFRVKSKKCLALQCGEINIIKNIQKESNRSVFRLKNRTDLEKRFFDLLNNTDLILNPIHTPMGNQGKMEKRRELLSSNKRYYFSTSNSDEKHLIDSASLQFSFYDGARLNETTKEINKDTQIRFFDID